MPTKQNLSKRHSKRETRPQENELPQVANEETTREGNQAEVFTLSPADSIAFAALLLELPAVNERLARAARAYGAAEIKREDEL